MRVVNSIDPLLRLDHYAPVLRYIGSVPLHMLLALLDRYSAIEIVAGVDLQALLVGVDVELDPGAVRGHGEHTDVVRFRSGISRAIEDESIVVAYAPGTAAIHPLEDITTNLLRRREIKPGSVDDANGARGYLQTIDFDISVIVGHLQGIVEDRLTRSIDEGSEVPVDMIREHDWGRLVEWYRNQSRCPSRASGYSVSGIRDDVARETFESLV